jgi:predicted dehydrogenase
MGKQHMRGVVAKEGACLYAVCDTEKVRLAACRDEFSVPVATTNWRELVNDPALNAVVIVTPDKLHTEMTCAFLRAGKDVLCEKPMALTMSECEEMMRVEKESGRHLMIGQVCRCTPGFLLAKQLVDDGRIGELFFVESEYAHHYGHARGYDDWRVDADRHAVIGGGCHAIDLLRWIAGDPEEVYAYANHKSLTDWPVDDCTVAIYRFPNGVAGKVFVSIGCLRDYTMRSVFYGTRGTIICDNTSPTITLYEHDPANGKTDFTAPVQLPVEVNNHNVVAEIDMFVNALLSGKEMPVTSMEGAATVAVACATVEAAKEGHPIQIRYPQV